MKQVAWIAAASLALTSMPTPAAAKVTHQQLAEACRGPLDALVRDAITGHEEDIASRKRDAALIGTGTTDHFTKQEIQRERDSQEAEIRGVEKQLADYRAKGIEAGEMREFLDQFREAGATATKADLRKGLAAARGQSEPQPQAGVEICLLETFLADREGRPLQTAGKTTSGGAAVPALRPTITQEAHNPAGDATDCLEPIFHTEFKARGIKSAMEAAIRNSCARPVSVTWCINGWDCKPGYSNLGSVPARGDMPVSFVYKGPTRMRLAGCYSGFNPGQGELSKKLLHSCK